MIYQNSKKKSEPTAKNRGPWAVLLGNEEFIRIIVFCAIPAKIILTGFLYLFVPIYLANLDASQSEIGQYMILYSLIIIPVSPIASRFADHFGRTIWIVIIATIFSGVILMSFYQNPNAAMVIVVVLLLGVVHAFLKAPLIVAAMEAAEKSSDITRTNALSLLRTGERIGSVVGPIVVAAMLTVLDFGQVASSIGVFVAFFGIIMATITLRKNIRREKKIEKCLNFYYPFCLL